MGEQVQIINNIHARITQHTTVEHKTHGPRSTSRMEGIVSISFLKHMESRQMGVRRTGALGRAIIVQFSPAVEPADIRLALRELNKHP